MIFTQISFMILNNKNIKHGAKQTIICQGGLAYHGKIQWLGETGTVIVEKPEIYMVGAGSSARYESDHQISVDQIVSISIPQ